MNRNSLLPVLLALAQFLVPVVALMIRPADFSPGVAKVLGLNFFLVLLSCQSAILFRHANGKPGATGVHSAA